VRSAAKTIYTCPMHPEIEQDHPGECPICGMALEPRDAPPDGAAEDPGELPALQRKLWFSGALALPVFVLTMGEMIPALRVQAWMPPAVSGWVQLGLATLAVFGPGGFIFGRA